MFKNNFNIDNKAQISLEFMLIAMISLLIISLVSIPLLGLGMDYSKDVVDSLNVKTELNKIVAGITFCYNSGRGSKKILLLDFNKDTYVRFLNNNSNGLAIASIGLSDNSSNTICQSFDYPLLNEEIHFSKGYNKLKIEWSEDSNLIELTLI